MDTDRENFHATCEHRRPDRLLYYASFTPDLQLRVREHIGTDDIAGHYGFLSPQRLKLPRPEGVEPPDYSRYWNDADLPEGTVFESSGVARIPAGFYHFWKYVSPLRDAKSLREIEQYPLEDVRGWDTSPLDALVAQAHRDGRVAEGFCGHMYETAWQIRGYEQFLTDMIERPAWAECLLERLAEQNMARAVAYAKAGADWIRTGDDVAHQQALMFAPSLWRKMIHSRWARIFRAVKDIRPAAKLWYHSDGNVTPIIGELIEAGLDILNPLQPEALDLDAVHARYGDHLTFDGCVGTQSTMPFASPKEVEARVRELIDRYGRSGGLILSPTHVLEPEVPIANVDAFADACRRYGRFADQAKTTEA